MNQGYYFVAFPPHNGWLQIRHAAPGAPSSVVLDFIGNTHVAADLAFSMNADYVPPERLPWK